MLDGHVLVDAHIHAAAIPTLKPAWRQWAQDFGDAAELDLVYRADGYLDPAGFSAMLDSHGVDHAFLLCEYSPKATGIQPIQDLMPLAEHDPDRVHLLANLNPHLHFPVAEELQRQLDLGAVGLKLHPVHGGFAVNDRALYPAYELCRTAGRPVVVHCGTSSFPGSTNAMADPVLLDDVLRDFPGLDVVLAHGGRGLVVRRGGVPRPVATRTCGSSCPGCRRPGCRTTIPGRTSGGCRDGSSSAPTGRGSRALPATPVRWRRCVPTRRQSTSC
ncbi:MAG: amidohydrolase family protein [Geodermatophilaceae bacterium]